MANAAASSSRSGARLAAAAQEEQYGEAGEQHVGHRVDDVHEGVPVDPGPADDLSQDRHLADQQQRAAEHDDVERATGRVPRSPRCPPGRGPVRARPAPARAGRARRRSRAPSGTRRRRAVRRTRARRRRSTSTWWCRTAARTGAARPAGPQRGDEAAHRGQPPSQMLRVSARDDGIRRERLEREQPTTATLPGPGSPSRARRRVPRAAARRAGIPHGSPWVRRRGDSAAVWRIR